MSRPTLKEWLKEVLYSECYKRRNPGTPGKKKERSYNMGRRKEEKSVRKTSAS